MHSGMENKNNKDCQKNIKNIIAGIRFVLYNKDRTRRNF